MHTNTYKGGRHRGEPAAAEGPQAPGRRESTNVVNSREEGRGRESTIAVNFSSDEAPEKGEYEHDY